MWGPHVETDSKGRYHLALTPGDWDLRAQFGQEYSQITKIHVVEHAKTRLDLNVSKIEPYSAEKDGSGDPKDPCAPERVGWPSWSRWTEDNRRMGFPAKTPADYELNIGVAFRPRASAFEAAARPGPGRHLIPKGSAIVPQTQSARDLRLREAEAYYACAEKWLTASCSHGNRQACSQDIHDQVSVFYWMTSTRYAYSPPQNYLLALEWAQKGSAAGYVQSMKTLGEYYLNGIVTEKDHTQAFKWFSSAAQGGCVSAMRSVARMYDEGDGVGRDRTQAAFWATLGGAAVPSGLSHSELTQVQSLASAWTPSKDAKGKCIEPAASSGATSSLPIQLRPTGTAGSNPVLTITNDSALSWQIAFAGPSNYNVSVAPHGSQTITLTPGTYFISGQTNNAGVIPFAPANYTFPRDVSGTFTISVQ
jgi:hypothetical protein